MCEAADKEIERLRARVAFLEECNESLQGRSDVLADRISEVLTILDPDHWCGDY